MHNNERVGGWMAPALLGAVLGPALQLQQPVLWPWPAYASALAVSLVADYKNNVTDDRSGKGRAALSALAEAGCDVRVISAYPIHHDKVLIVDRQTVELGSFNYSDAAARVNSENVLVNWNNPALAKAYLAHFDRNWRQSEPFRARY